MKSFVWCLVAAMMALLAACGGGGTTSAAPQPPGAPGYPVGLTTQTIQSGGVTRQFRIHVPPALQAPRAIVFVLHGGGGLGMGVADTGAHPLSVFRPVADREGFVVVYPGGLPAPSGDVGWNDCRSDNFNGSSADDVRFLADLVDLIKSTYGLPSTRVFMAGGSNGGLMSFAFAFNHPQRIAAIAVSSANLPENPKSGACTSGLQQPLPVLMTHGTLDPQMPYGGGCVADFGGACLRGRVTSAQATRNWWLTLNGLASAQPTETVIERSANDAGPANRFVYAGARPVQWWRLDGAGHSAASRTVLIPTTVDNGAQNRDIEFAEVAWEFFASLLP